MVISTRLGGDGLGLRTRRGQDGQQLALLFPAFPHLGKQHRRHRGHVGRLGPRDAGHEVHGADEHVVQSAAHVTEQADQERHHGPCDAGHLHQQAQHHEQGNGEQDEV
jgi:hypothetical protein